MNFYTNRINATEPIFSLLYILVAMSKNAQIKKELAEIKNIHLNNFSDSNSCKIETLNTTQ